MKRTDRKAYERANRKDKVVGGIISFVVVVLVGGLLISIFTAQQKQRQTFDEQTIEQTSKKKTSVEKRIERERSSVERINDSLDTAESVREPAQNGEVVVPETSQAETTGADETTESMGSPAVGVGALAPTDRDIEVKRSMGSSWTKEDMQPQESSENIENKKSFGKESMKSPKSTDPAVKACDHEWGEADKDDWANYKCKKCGFVYDEPYKKGEYGTE